MPSSKQGWEDNLQKAMSPDYVLIGARSFGAVHLSVWIRQELNRLVSDVQIDHVSVGIGNMLNNKGGIGVAFLLGSTSCLFITSHLAAGHHNTVARNDDFHRINTKLFANTPIGTTFDKPVTTLFDRAFWMGDLNYRIEGDKAAIENLIKSNKLDFLRPHDQLTMAKKRGKAFVGFKEGKLTFPPTYKFDAGTSNYDTSVKARIPAWTDRVLWRPSHHIEQLEYNCCKDNTYSDHRPVYAAFTVQYFIGPHTERDERVRVRKPWAPCGCQCNIL
eukprot:TRINITY_DN7341_c0_g1_i2.p1 TRINITY_DN7341_c0_g1~~TRINITY_DN7341_c0_g1_i2.p1  ORF type:complete len:274 (+),score=36.83 TRINITY_DN7341_c0_g1_i2:303-1124(+)